MLIVCYAASWVFKTRPHDLTNLTIWDRTPGSVR